MNESALVSSARTLMAPGKGILVADESQPSIGTRFTPALERAVA